MANSPVFEASRRKLLAAHPDAAETLQEAHNHGLTMSPEATHEIVRLGCPEVAYFLSRPEHQEAAAALMNLPPHAQVLRIGQLQRQLAESGQPFDPDTDEYLAKRKQDKREGRR